MDKWQPIETAEKTGAVLWGYTDGVQFSMVWRLPGWFKHHGFTGPEEKTGAWVAQGYGVVCFQGNQQPNIVRPTHWAKPLPPPLAHMKSPRPADRSS